MPQAPKWLTGRGFKKTDMLEKVQLKEPVLKEFLLLASALQSGSEPLLLIDPHLQLQFSQRSGWLCRGERWRG